MYILFILLSVNLNAEVISGPSAADEVNNNGGVFANTTYSIDISLHTDISWTMNWGESGNLELADRIRIRYRVDGATPWTTVVIQNGDICAGGGPCALTATGAAGLEGDLLEVRVRVRNDNNAEYWHWEGLTVSGTPIPLPVELLYFTVKQDNTRLSFKWETAVEINNEHFCIEESIDGITYNTLEFIEGAGNSQTPIQYQIDILTTDTINKYYRLKQVDYDGTITYSDIIHIINNVLSRVIVAVYDINGRPVDINTKELVIIRYSDGHIIKRINR